jgi:hypothetical protein
VRDSKHHLLSRLARHVLLLIALLSTNPVAAAIEAYADPRNLDEMESLRLTLRIDGISDIGKPDTSPLDQDFEILTSNTTSQYRSVNGTVQSWVELQLMLRPKRSGKLTIPALTIGSDTSQPLQIQVNPLDANIKQAIDDMVFFETEVSPNPVYVQSETLLTRRLFYSTSGGVQMYSEMPGAPEIADAVVLPLGQTNSYSTERDGINYGVVEQHFAIIPEHSGMLEIPVVAITSSIRLMKNGRVRRSGIRVSSDAVSVKVMPIPAEYPADQPWLAATNLRLVELWTPNQPVFNVGEPITRHIEARVTGNVASAIPPLTTSLDTKAFRQYPEPPELNDITTAVSVEGSRSERFSILPTTPGFAEIPPVSITWWDVKQQKVQVTNLPAQRVQITGNAPAVDSTNSTANIDATSVAPQPPAIESEPLPATPWEQILIWVTGTFGLCLLLGWLWRKRSQRPHPLSTTNDLNHGSKSKPRNRRQSLKALELHLTGTPSDMRQGLVEFAVNQLGVSSQLAVLALQQHQATQPILAQLNASLYGAKDPSSRQEAMPDSSLPTAAAVLAAAQAFAKPVNQAQTPTLPSLYPAR